MISSEHREYLKRRGIDPDFAETQGLNSRGPRLAFPYQIVASTVEYEKQIHLADKSKTIVDPSGVSQDFPWNIPVNIHDRGHTLVITEGEIDCLSVRQALAETEGIDVVSLPSGAASTKGGCVSKASRVFQWQDDNQKMELEPEWSAYHKIILATDCDHDGLLMQQALVDIFGDNFCFICDYPEGCKDANDILRIHGEQALFDVISNAQSVRQGIIFESGSVGYRDKPPEVFDLKIPWLNAHYRPPKDGLTIVGGPAGIGKSTVKQYLELHMAVNNRAKVGLLHFEGQRAIVTRRWGNWYRANINDSTGSPKVQEERNQWIDEHFGFIRPPRQQLPDFEWLKWVIDHTVRDYGCNVISIDPWNKIAHQRDTRKSITEHVSECIIDLKRLSEDLKFHLIITHHIAKPAQRNLPPVPYDLSDSAHWNNSADHVIMVSTPKSGINKTLIDVAKSKDHELFGRPGHVWVSLNGPKFELYPVEAPEVEGWPK